MSVYTIIRRFLLLILGLLALAAISGCYDLANPVDPDADNYQGFRTERTDGYTILYDANGADTGSVPVDGALYTAGDTVVIATNIGSLGLTGNTFVGWNTAVDGSGSHYNPNNRVSMPAADVTLYAIWTNGPTYSVTYSNNSADGGTAPVDTHAYLSGTTVTVQGNSGGLVKNGYRFYSWDTQSDGLGLDYWGGSTFTVGGDITLNADWDPDFAGGDGSIISPFQVNTVGHLNNVRYFPVDNFILTADLDLNVAPWDSGSGWIPIGDGTTAFEGFFEGAGHTISNLYIFTTTGIRQGLFGFINGSTIKNLAVLNADITAGGGYSGVLAGTSNSLATDTIENCFVTGVLSAGQQSGGLIGRTSFITVSQCFADVDVTVPVGVHDQIGGLVGNNTTSGTIRDSYALGNVAGTNQVGGLVGLNAGTVETSYAAGGVSGTSFFGGLIGDNTGSAIPDSYYDSDTTGQSDAGKGIGLSSALMTDSGNFGGWDFGSIWQIDTGVSYPYFQWQGVMIPIPTSGNNISYLPNGADSGIPPADASSYLPGAAITILGNSGGLAKTGFVFSGWNTATDGTGTDYAVGPATMPAANLNLYALWETPELSARWAFAPGSEYFDSGGVGNNLMLDAGTPSFGTLLMRDYLQFSTAGDRLTVATSYVNDITDGQSVSFWLYGDTPAIGSLISRYTVGDQPIWKIGPNLNGQLNVLASGTYIGGSAVDFSTGFSASAWNHFVVTFDILSSTANVYVNNAAPQSFSFDSSQLDFPAGIIYVGNNPDVSGAGDASTNSQIADVRLFNYILSPTEVDTIYNE